MRQGRRRVIHRAGDPQKQDDAKAEIRVDSLRDVAGPKRKAELANYLDKKHRPLPPDEIVERARKRLGQKGYNLLSKNCEHFATWCRYGDGIGVTQGEGISEQVTHYTNNFGMV
ncbi:phospholipase A and acyltransferase 1-like [Littorina saxatilis]|uniref:phospholipase A and acyltransferase 1-like n=1 Tax=Littorina saxatilis TaxID=31220 RepID=UPI0038B51323